MPLPVIASAARQSRAPWTATGCALAVTKRLALAVTKKMWLLAMTRQERDDGWSDRIPVMHV